MSSSSTGTVATTRTRKRPVGAPEQALGAAIARARLDAVDVIAVYEAVAVLVATAGAHRLGTRQGAHAAAVASFLVRLLLVVEALHRADT